MRILNSAISGGLVVTALLGLTACGSEEASDSEVTPQVYVEMGAMEVWCRETPGPPPDCVDLAPHPSELPSGFPTGFHLTQWVGEMPTTGEDFSPTPGFASAP